MGDFFSLTLRQLASSIPLGLQSDSYSHWLGADLDPPLLEQESPAQMVEDGMASRIGCSGTYHHSALWLVHGHFWDLSRRWLPSCLSLSLHLNSLQSFNHLTARLSYLLSSNYHIFLPCHQSLWNIIWLSAPVWTNGRILLGHSCPTESQKCLRNIVCGLRLYLCVKTTLYWQNPIEAATYFKSAVPAGSCTLVQGAKIYGHLYTCISIKIEPN